MQIAKMLTELRVQQEQVDAAIRVLEQLAAMRNKPQLGERPPRKASSNEPGPGKSRGRTRKGA